MLGFAAKRALIDLLTAEATNPGSDLYQVKVAYSWPDTNLPSEVIYGAGGTGPADDGVAEGVVEFDTAIVSIVVRVAGMPGTERATDTRAEQLTNAVTAAIRGNRHVVGPNVTTTVTGRQWDNPAVQQEAVTVAVIETTTKGYV